MTFLMIYNKYKTNVYNIKDIFKLNIIPRHSKEYLDIL